MQDYQSQALRTSITADRDLLLFSFPFLSTVTYMYCTSPQDLIDLIARFVILCDRLG